MRQSSLLILNTCISYASFVVKVIAGILLIRFLLDVLGEDDYGIYSALAASSALLAVLQAAVADGARRHMSIEVGTGNRQALTSVFNCTLLLMLFAAVLIIAIGLAIGDSVVAVVNVPAERFAACKTAYAFSVVSMAILAVTIPWQAFLTSKQQLGVLSTLAMIQPFLIIAGIVLMRFIPGDVIAVYAAISLAVLSFTCITTVAYCLVQHPESRPKPTSVRWSDMRSIVQFGSWIVFESLSVAMREKGSLLLLAAFFGHGATAAYDIALRLGSQFASLVSSLSRAIAPALTNAEGRGDTKFAISLGDVLSRYAGYISGGFLIPFLLETEAILNLLIGTSSSEMVLFARLIVLTRFIGTLSWGDGIVAKSQNRIAVISLGLTLPFIVVTLLVWAAFALGYSQNTILPLSMLAVTALGGIWFRPWYIRKLNSMKWNTFLHDVLMNIGKAMVPATIAAWLVFFFLPPSVSRLFAVIFVYNAISLTLIWQTGMSEIERSRMTDLVGTGIAKASAAFGKTY